jgi:hypothetical protein
LPDILARGGSVARVGAEVGVGDGVEQAAPVVHQHEADLGGLVPGREAAHERPEEHRLAGPGVPENQQVRVTVGQVEADRAQVGIAQADGHGGGLPTRRTG